MRVAPCETAWELMPLGECRGAWRSQLGALEAGYFSLYRFAPEVVGRKRASHELKLRSVPINAVKLRFFLVHAVIKAQVAANRRGVAHLALKARRWLGWEPDLSPIPLRL